MIALHHNSFVPGIGAFLIGALIFALPTSSARGDDDDWEDRWEDYYEELEEREEEARERWEDRRERLEELHEQGAIVRYGPPHHYYVPHGGNHVYGEPGARYYKDFDRPVHDPYYLPPPNRYEVFRPAYRYYGTPRIGYYDFRRGGAVRIGPIQVFWD